MTAEHETCASEVRRLLSQAPIDLELCADFIERNARNRAWAAALRAQARNIRAAARVASGWLQPNAEGTYR